MALQSGVEFAQKGYQYDLDEFYKGSQDPVTGYDKTTYNYLEVPLNVNYRFWKGLQIQAGMYGAFGIGGKSERKGSFNGQRKEERGLKPVFKKLDRKDFLTSFDKFNGFNYGFNFGIGYRVGHILFNTEYSIGLNNAAAPYRDLPDQTIERNRVGSFSVTYFL